MQINLTHTSDKMKESENTYKIAFAFLKEINANIIKFLSDKEVSPEDFFNIPTNEIIKKLGIGKNHEYDKLIREEALAAARKEWELIRKHNLEPLFLTDDNYPSRLYEIEDAPIILYKLGEGNLNSDHILSVVGTRRPTSYGMKFCDCLIDEIGDYFQDAVVVSGLAYGIDGLAHKKSLEKGISTIAVVAHGLNMIYPAQHRSLAKEIIKEGGAIISEYPFGVKPFRQNFLARNRIIAGLSDVTVVVESALKGGAMSTANFAFSYSRDVWALPGKISDEKSAGCNLLIRKQKASLIGGAADLIETTGWEPMNKKIPSRQRNLFPELDGDLRVIYELLKFNSEPLQIDYICQVTNLPANNVLSAIGELEFDGIIIRHPGNRFSLA